MSTSGVDNLNQNNARSFLYFSRKTVRFRAELLTSLPARGIIYRYMIPFRRRKRAAAQTIPKGFDPQVEDNIAAGGTIRYLRLSKTYEEVADKYIRYWDDVVQDNIMAGEDAGPTYAFGHGGSYVSAINETRTGEGLAPLTWDPVLARAALRVALGENSEVVGAELERQTGRRCIFYKTYGTAYTLGGPNLDSSYKSIGIGFCGVDACVVYSVT